MMGFIQEPEFWILISFVIFVTMGIKLGKRAVTAKLDQRINMIRVDIETAESLRREAQALLQDYTERQKSAVTEAETIIENARRHAEQIHLQAEEDLKETVKRREQQMAERLQRIEEAAVQDIRAYAAELTVKATAEIIAAQMDEKTSMRLIDESIATMAKDAA